MQLSWLPHMCPIYSEGCWGSHQSRPTGWTGFSPLRLALWVVLVLVALVVQMRAQWSLLLLRVVWVLTRFWLSMHHMHVERLQDSLLGVPS